MTSPLVTALRALPALSDAGPRRSDIVSYDNVLRIPDAADWNYKGTPLNAGAGWNTDWRNIYLRYAGGRADKLRLEWLYTYGASASLNTVLRPAYVSGAVNGFIVSSVPEPYGSRTLYGARALTRGTTNSAADVTDPTELARLLGPAPAGSTLADNMRGVSDWHVNAPFVNGILHDEALGHASVQFSYGGLSATAVQGFTGHGQAADYRTYLRSLYANDAAYNAARDAGTVPAYSAYTAHLTRQSVDYLAQQCKPRCTSLGYQLGINCFNALATEHPGTSYVCLASADYGLSELLPARYLLRAEDANSRTDRIAAEDFATAVTLRRYFAAISLHVQALRAFGKRGAYALQPPYDWVPQPTSLNGPPPTTAWTVPPRVKCMQRLGFAWLLANGASPIIPLGIFDLFIQNPGGFTSFAGYTGLNRTLWSGPVDDYADLFQWIAARGDILDDYEDAPTVMVMEPLTSNWWGPSAGQAASTSRYYKRVVDLLEPCVSARVPMAVAAVGGAVMALPISRYGVDRVLRAVKPTADNEYTDNNGTVPTGSNVVTAADFISAGVAQWSPVTVAGERDGSRPVLVNARVRRDGKAMTLHCVNTDAMDFGGGGSAHWDSGYPQGAYRAARAGLVVTLKPWAWLAGKRPTVRWFSPESATQGRKLAATVTAAGLEIRLPALLEYGVIALDFA